MTIRYPNGKVFQGKDLISSGRSTSPTLYGNRGMSLEEDLQESNQYYLIQNIAVVHKKPTPIQIVDVHYPKRSAAVIKEAYFKQASTTDFNGVYKGRYIDFEAKETKNKTSFPLQNFHAHQIQHMQYVVKQNGICFVILMFSSLNEIYLLPAEKLFYFWERKESGQRKSITKTEVEENGYLIPIGYQPRIDYIKVINEFF
ncbi:Holliday junction resolvase RecU [Sutcliffiella rhizosphaerae]|uniref:Holliday junction resolvase RecU n=1 Tax=Sutcliffiella rhizosphaerae TaxID=2880967 RepID=A0ABN8AHQ6_9BACI|nr:Holliday junction resolvase RecU [Sutcliffiella rhizosphaerae]CAG9622613.1 Holliday junction resolvase RecU [Sutcliffiella rhizosphaerae]